MYPTDWKRFLAYFEMETSRPYGKVIIDLHPNTDEKDRFIDDDGGDDSNNNAVLDDGNHTLRRMEARQEMNHPYMNKLDEMNSLLNNRLMSESEKTMKY